MIRVQDNSEALGRAFDRVMREKAKDNHDFIPMNIGGMEKICDKCCHHITKGNHTIIRES